MLVDPETGRPRKFAYSPGLVVVDGGPPQVAAAQRALDELGIDDVPVCGLAKRPRGGVAPRARRPGHPRALERGPLPAAAGCATRRNRFAITHHRGRRSRPWWRACWTTYPVSGEVRRKTLLKHFGSLRKLRAATVAEIALVPGIGERTAIAIKAAVEQSSGKTVSVNTATGEIDES
jgi:excinuclease ABC subunit C